LELRRSHGRDQAGECDRDGKQLRFHFLILLFELSFAVGGAAIAGPRSVSRMI
jgi:hypothetical protein